ncbi:hypothetical protein LB467_16725 [Salegentibacter sp. JZCK2]|uniref:DUF7660 family protein n=1 Tax=Salegentibacter tibetensis TaxID=2873600 RepID=UPI001CCB42A6|nr:hypothetical protein [Salegentibacter tibetensis]MBZ9731336.1 hypothetical protein [Salegentibacter tibetensis]
MDIDFLAEKIENKEDFDLFLKSLKEDYDVNKAEWGNVTLADFLEALGVYSKEIEGYYKNMNIPFNKKNPSWKVFADILLGARIYE